MAAGDAGRLIEIRRGPSSGPQVVRRFEYTRFGDVRLIKGSSPSVTIANHTYDGRRRLVFEGLTAAAMSRRYAYDDEDQVASVQTLTSGGATVRQLDLTHDGPRTPHHEV